MSVVQAEAMASPSIFYMGPRRHGVTAVCVATAGSSLVSGRRRRHARSSARSGAADAQGVPQSAHGGSSKSGPCNVPARPAAPLLQRATRLGDEH